MPTARWDIGPRRVFTEQVEWIARVHVERRRAQGRRDDAKRPLLTVQVCAGGVRSRPTTLPAAPQRTFIRPAEDKMRPGGGEPRYAVSDCCSRIHVSTCPAQFGAPCQGLAPAEASRIPWGFCRYIQLYSLSLDTGNHSTPARARETASAGAGETPASGHADARIPGWQPRSTLNRRQDRLQRDSARDAGDHNREPRCRRIGRCGRDSRQFGYLLISHSASLSGLMVRHAVGSAPSACRFDEILDSLQSERRGIVVSRWS